MAPGHSAFAGLSPNSVSAMPQQQAPSMSPEIQPALDENRPQFGPNMASDQKLCVKVLDFCQRDYVYPYVVQQQQLWNTWRRIDDAFRVKGEAFDLDIAASDPQSVSLEPDRKGKGGLTDPQDGKARMCPATLFKQITTKVDMHMNIAWADFPVHADVPENTFENPLYNPTQQSVDAANCLLQDCARDIRLKKSDRIGRGSFAAYGFAVAGVDFEYELEDAKIPMAVPMDRQQQQLWGQAMIAQYGQPVDVQPTPFGMVATFVQRTVKKMRTSFIPIRKDNCFFDLTIPVGDWSDQPCPVVRTRCTKNTLFGNDYDPQTNPFGYLNCQQALQDNAPQWTFSMSDQVFQQELRKKWGLQITGQIKSKDAIKQKWTMYPMLALYQDPGTGEMMIDQGGGIDCPACGARGKVMHQPPAPPPQVGMDQIGNHVLHQPAAPAPQEMTCPQCNGLNKIFIQPQRYVVEAFGNLDISGASATCLRIQRNPTVKDRVPLLFTANLTEDTAGAIPICKAEASLKAIVQEATAYNQWQDAKNYLINPSWLLPEGAAVNRDYNKPNQNTECVGDPRTYIVNRMAVDPTGNLLPFMSQSKDDIMDIMGMSPSLLGQISSGRRAATEIQNAFDAGKMPIQNEVDQYGEDMLAGWAQFHLDNIEAFADRNWIRAITGREVFGKVQLKSNVGDQYFQRQAAVANLQYLAQLVGARPDANLSPILGAFVRICKLDQYIDPNEVLPDGGQKKAVQDALRIVTTILGTGQFLPPTPSDPHPIYIGAFEEALKDPYWQKATPETIPLLNQRLMAQLQMQAMQQQQQHMLAEAHMGASLGQHFKPQQGGQTGTTGNQPPMTNQPPATAGGANQQLIGAAQQQ